MSGRDDFEFETERPMRSTIHPIQSARSDGSFRMHTSVNVLQINEIY